LEIIDFVRRERPLVRVGPFVVAASNDNRRFSVREQSSGLTLVTLRSDGQFKYLTLYSSQEQGHNLPRFNATFIYSEDGVYKRGRFFVGRGEGGSARTYEDNTGTGVFDIMRSIDKNEFVTYRLNDLTWEREVSVPNPWPPGVSPPPMLPPPPGSPFIP